MEDIIVVVCVCEGGGGEGELFSIIGWNFGLIHSVFQKSLKVQVGSVIYTQK